MQGGVKKQIDASAMDMIMKNLQAYQYQRPIPSTVRELVSNGIDSIEEKKMAIAILTGKNKIADYFVDKEGIEFEDSKFDPTYYDLKWLSDSDQVFMNYIVNGPLEKDQVIITDNGVGLGSYRLEKYFSLGYSTKRLSKLPLGKFGIGGKAALSVVDFYTMESRYNGRLYRFNIYSSSFDSIIPEQNIGTGKDNAFILFNEGTEDEYKVYYEETTLKNGVTLTITAKKAHLQAYIDAVKSQLLYFPNITFNIDKESGIEKIDYRARIIYEDDKILLSDNQYWSKPHLLLNKVNYGYINWDELELEHKNGNIGIKLLPEDVDVNPSRESIIWNDRTKATVLKRFEDVVGIATEIIAKELHETDYIKWLRACSQVSGRFSQGNGIIERLAKIVDLTAIKPSFGPNPKLRFEPKRILGGLSLRKVQISRKHEGGRWREVVEYTEVGSIMDVLTLPIFTMKVGEKMENRKNKYILMDLFKSLSAYGGQMSSFVCIMEPIDSKEDMVLAGFSEGFIERILTWKNKEGKEGVELRKMAWEALLLSSEIKVYSDVIVPEDFKGTQEETVSEQEDEPEDEEEEQKPKAGLPYIRPKRIAPKELRKQQGKTLIYSPSALSNGQYKMQRLEVPISMLGALESEEVYVIDRNEQQELIFFVAALTRDSSPHNDPTSPNRRLGFGNTKSSESPVFSYQYWADKKWYRVNKETLSNMRVQPYDAYALQHFFDSKEIALLQTTPESRPYTRNFLPINKFFSRITENKLTMSNVLIKWNTARIIKAKLHIASFLYNWDIFNEVYAKYFQTLCDYVDQNYREVEEYLSTGGFKQMTVSTYTDLISHLDKTQQFQEFVMTKPSEKDLSDMAQYMFGNEKLTDAQAIDMNMMNILKKVTEYVNAVGQMFNYMPIFTGYTHWAAAAMAYDRKVTEFRTRVTIPDVLEVEIKQYLSKNNLLDYGREEKEEKEFEQFYDQMANASPVVIEHTEDEAKLFIQDGVDSQVPYTNEVF